MPRFPFLFARTPGDICRGSDAPIGQSKKAKKNQANKSAAALALDVGDRAALNRRAERFRREHELEKQKQNGGGGQASSFRNNQRLAHPFVNHSRSATPSANVDDPEVDPVSV
jgi:SAC3 family protein LENG8/THP3